MREAVANCYKVCARFIEYELTIFYHTAHCFLRLSFFGWFLKFSTLLIMHHAADKQQIPIHDVWNPMSGIRCPDILDDPVRCLIPFITASIVYASSPHSSLLRFAHSTSLSLGFDHGPQAICIIYQSPDTASYFKS